MPMVFGIVRCGALMMMMMMMIVTFGMVWS